MKKPPAFLALCVIGIVLGLSSLCCGGIGVASPIVQDRLSAMQEQQMQSDPGAGAGDATEMIRRMRAQQRATMPYTVALSLFGLVFGLSLVSTSALALATRPNARRWFGATLSVGFVWTLLQGLGNGFIQYRTGLATQEMMRGAMPTGGSGPDMSSVMAMSLAGGLCWVFVIALVKLLYFGGGVLYLHLRGVELLFSPDHAGTGVDEALGPRGD